MLASYSYSYMVAIGLMQNFAVQVYLVIVNEAHIAQNQLANLCDGLHHDCTMTPVLAMACMTAWGK